MLKEPNYAKLTGDSTTSLIHIMNNLLKDMKQKKKEIWVLFQDMKKVFDSVSLKMLELVLERIKLLRMIISFLLSLYDKRKICVITEFRLTENFVAQDSIDQKEVIFL